MRAYYHHKSADWKQNQPFPLKSWTASELEKMPTYYIMDLKEGMAGTVAKEMQRRPRSWRTSGCPTTNWRVRARIWPQRLSGRPAVVPLQYQRRQQRGAAAFLRPHDRHTVMLHRGQERLGIYQRPGGDMIKMQKTR